MSLLTKRCTRRNSYESVNHLHENGLNGGVNEAKNRPNKKLGRFMRVILTAVGLFLLILLLIFVVFPVAFKFFSDLRKIFVFPTNVQLPKQSNYSDLEWFGLEGARNFYLDYKGSKLGVWHILPSDLVAKNQTKSTFDQSLKQGPLVLLYNHGNTGSRGTSYRVDMYKVLRKQFHIITYDYRGFGDSTGDHPEFEADVTDDGIFMARWVLSQISPEVHLFLWGHSVGSTVTLAATAALKKENNVVPTGIILESTFHNGRETISQTPSMKFFRFLPWYDNCIMDSIMDHNGGFQNYKYVADVDCPILMVHSEDDRTISYKHAEKLYKEALNSRSKTRGTVQFEVFSQRFGAGHNHITKAANFSTIIQSFVESALNQEKRDEHYKHQSKKTVTENTRDHIVP